MEKKLTFKEKFIGDRDFYREVLSLSIPLVIQQFVTSFVNMLDNIMVGQTGTYAMSGVSIANQIIDIVMLAIFGLISAASIYGAQFVGSRDMRKVRDTLIFKLITSGLISLLGGIIIFIWGRPILLLFMQASENSKEAVSQSLGYGLDYSRIMVFGLIPFALSQSISSTLRENGETKIPMFISLAAVITNFIFNTLLIFGKLGFPRLGPAGAAIATVISRFVELFLTIFAAYKNRFRFTFFHNFFKEFEVDRSLFKKITRNGIPLILNEILFSISLAAITQAYSTRGLDAVAAVSIAATMINLFTVFNAAMGACISILVGQKLGEGKREEAVLTDSRLIFLTFLVGVLVGLLLALLAPLFSEIYKTSDLVKDLATQMIRVGGFTLRISSLYTAFYYTLRCGGKTLVTFLFDSVGSICVTLPVAYYVALKTSLPIVPMYLIVRLVDIYKVVLGLILVRKGIWVKVLVEEPAPEN